MELKPCRTRGDWRLFERIPELLHGDDPAFVPPIPGDVAALGRTRHPFHGLGSLRAYVALREGTPVGRVASIVNRVHNEFHGDRVGFFGFFDFTDADVARRLIDQVRSDLEAQGRDVIRGPFNPTQNDPCGLIVDGFGERPFFGMPYNPPWYPEVYETLGLEGACDLLAYPLLRDLEAQFDARLGGLVRRMKERFDFTVRPLDMDKLDEEAALVCRLFNESLAEEWNFMPLTVEVARAFAKELGGYLDPEALLVAEVDGEPAGLSLVLPDVNEFMEALKSTPRWLRLPRLFWFLKTRKCRRARWAVFGMLPEYRKRGATLLLVHESIQRGKLRYAEGEISWTQEINPEVNRLAGQLGLTPSRRYRVYETRTLRAGQP